MVDSPAAPPVPRRLWEEVRPPRVFWSFLALWALGFAVRALGARFGLPYLWHPDEPQVLNRAIHMLQVNDLDPGFYGYPSLTIYLQTLGVAAWQLGEASRGVAAPLDAVHTGFDTGIYHTVGNAELWLRARLLTAALGGLGAPFVWMAGRRLFGERVGLFAGLFFVFAPQAVELGRFVTVDALGATAVAATFAGAAWMLHEGDPRHHLRTGIALGLAIGAKYTLAVAAVLPLTAWALSPAGRDRRLFWMLAVFPVAGLVFVATMPMALLAPGDVLEAIAGEATHYYVLDEANPELATGAGLPHVGRVLWYFAGTGLPIWSLAALVGLPIAWRRDPRATLLLLAYPVALVAEVARAKVFYHRNFVSLAVPLVLLAAVAAERLWRAWEEHGKGRARPLLAIATVLLLVPVGWTLREGLRLQRSEDTRVRIARAAATLPAGSVLGVPLELRIAPETLAGVETVPVNLVGEGPEDWVRRGATHVLGSTAALWAKSEVPGRRDLSLAPAVAWFAGRAPALHEDGGAWLVNRFAIDPEVGIWSLAEVAAAMPPEPDRPAPPPALDLRALCEAPPDVGPEIDAPENWRVLPDYFLDRNAWFAGGTIRLEPPAEPPAVLVCEARRLPVRTRVHLVGRWRWAGLPATGGIGARVTARFFDAEGTIAKGDGPTTGGIRVLGERRGTGDWTELDVWVGAPRDAVSVGLCLEALGDGGWVEFDDVRFDRVE